jgi:hypothetical protein
MKLPTLLLTGSLLANAALVATFALQPSRVPPAFRDYFTFGSAGAGSAGAAQRVATSPGQAKAGRAKLWTLLHTDDLATLVARLRAAGFPPSLIRAIVGYEINARYDAQLRALIEPNPNAPFWKQSNALMAGSKSMEEYSRLQRERSKLMRDLFSDPSFAGDDVSAGQRRQFGNLSRQKIDLVQRIEDDYAEMGSAIRAAMNGVTLPEDREKLALLTREKHADLAAVLTPDEVADYELRSSPLVGLLSRYLGGFDASEAEFRAVFQAQQTYGNTVAPGGGLPTGSMDPQTRQVALQQLNAQLQSSLGDARYADYQRETNRDFQQLTRLAQQENLPPATAIQAFNLRDVVAQESNRILDDTSLDADQKRAALQALAQATRSQTLTLLGPSVGPAYVKIQDSWLTNVERGSAVTFNNNFSTSSIATTNSSGVAAMITFTGGASYRRVPGVNARPGP